MILIAVLFMTITAHAQDKTLINYDYLITSEKGQPETKAADVLIVLSKSDLSLTVYINNTKIVKLTSVSVVTTGYFPNGIKYSKVKMRTEKGKYCWLFYSNGDTVLADSSGLVVFTNNPNR